jgi:SNF2 family DNA or RNA helicase
MKKIIYQPKTTPLPHQLEATQFLIQNDKAAVFDEQGVGKTKEVIDAIVSLLKQNVIGSAIIICPKTLIYTWQNEIRKHSYLVPVAIIGNQSSKGYRFLSAGNVYIINYEGIAAELSTIKLLLQTRRFMIVLDESQRIKDPNGQTFKAISEIKNFATRRVILTGTPVANKPTDLWSQFYFLDGGETLGNNFTIFKRDYKDNALTTQNLIDLQSRIKPKSIRRLKNNVLELPEKVFQVIEVELAPIQKNIYRKLKEELLVEVMKTEEKTIIDESKSILKKLLRLVQIASNPGLLVKDYTETPAKFAELDKLLKQIIQKGEKAIIWTAFVDNVKMLKRRYREYGSLEIFGEIPIADRNNHIQMFQEDKNYRVMIANPAAAREGITLTAANHAIYLDRSFNLVDYLQSQDRIHRISQDKRCNIIKLVAKSTIDLFIEDKLSRKQDVAAVVQGDAKKFNEDAYLTKEEIVEILH